MGLKTKVMLSDRITKNMNMLHTLMKIAWALPWTCSKFFFTRKHEGLYTKSKDRNGSNTCGNRFGYPSSYFLPVSIPFYSLEWKRFGYTWKNIQFLFPYSSNPKLPCLVPQKFFTVTITLNLWIYAWNIKCSWKNN